MRKFECTACGYIFDEELGDPDSGIAPGTKLKEVLIITGFLMMGLLRNYCL